MNAKELRDEYENSANGIMACKGSPVYAYRAAHPKEEA